MKRTHHHHAHLRLLPPAQPVTPNAADPSYFAQKALDVVTGIISGIGFVSAMLFLVTMS